MQKEKSAEIGEARGSRWVERLQLDHRRARGLLRLMSGQLDNKSLPVSERALIIRDVMIYMRRYLDPAHHAIEGLLLRAVEGLDRAFDSQLAKLDIEHQHAHEEGETILQALDRAIADDNAEAYSDALRQCAEYSRRMVNHFEYEEQHVFVTLEKLLQRLNPADLPKSVIDPVFEQQLSDEYAALQRHSLSRIEQAQQRRTKAEKKTD